MTELETDNLIKSIKQEFFSLRNGIVADHMRKIYPPDVITFGLTVPQFMELSKKYPKDIDLALKLWKNKKVRESRLLSLYVLPVNDLTYEQAKEMFFDLQSVEEADFLAFRVLRHLPEAKNLYEYLKSRKFDNEILDYGLQMLGKNLG